MMLTGYPSIDKPWLKYYSEEALATNLPKCSLYGYLYKCNLNNMDGYALNYFGKESHIESYFMKLIK